MTADWVRKAAQRVQGSWSPCGGIEEAVAASALVTGFAFPFAILSLLRRERFRYWAIPSAVLGGVGLALCALWAVGIIQVHLREVR